MRPAHSYQDPSMTPPDGPDLSDEPCDIKDCDYMAIEDQDLCEAHLQEEAEDQHAERIMDSKNNYGYEYPIGYDGR